MVVNRRKKVTKYRGYSTHGGGSRKKRRGHGSIGGSGRAGTGKKAGQKKVSKYCPLLGKSGFRRGVTLLPEKVINVGYFTPDKVKELIKEGKIIPEKETNFVDLEKWGYDKLLGTGQVNLKLKIKVKRFSSQAEEKVRAAGGEIVSPKEQPE